MDQNSQANGKPKAILEAQIRECFGRVVYSHKTHEKCADILHTRLSRIKITQILLSAVTTGGLVAAIIGNSRAGVIFSAIVSTSLLILNAYTKQYDLGELAQKHKQSAIDLWLAREQYLSLITDLRMGNSTTDTLQKRRDTLLSELHAVYQGAPNTNIKAYRRAQESLQKHEDMTFSDEEIDSFLPQELKKALRPGNTMESTRHPELTPPCE